ncbi:MAG: proprotein convertase P-domain-containing protein, partial [Haliscomenobacter sp.]|nr:proprotein convertase P-domain-containing protein [Haliscomenobacter sp.]
MKKSQILIPLLSLLAHSLFSQSPIILPNPSFCYDLGAIRDFTCPSNSGYYDPNRFVIRVIDAPGTALGTDVYLKEVRLIVQHSWAADLEIRLVSPGGKSALLTADNGGGENNYGVPAFRDCGSFASFSMASCDPIPPTGAPYISQPYLPQESFYVFNDSVTSPVGDWTL